MRYDTMTPTTLDLFDDVEPEQPPRREQIGEQSYVLRGFALPLLDRLLPALRLFSWPRHFGKWSRPAVSPCRWP